MKPDLIFQFNFGAVENFHQLQFHQRFVRAEIRPRLGFEENRRLPAQRQNLQPQITAVNFRRVASNRRLRRLTEVSWPAGLQSPPIPSGSPLERLTARVLAGVIFNAKAQRRRAAKFFEPDRNEF
jgi:hypothetical protein